MENIVDKNPRELVWGQSRRTARDCSTSPQALRCSARPCEEPYSGDEV